MNLYEININDTKYLKDILETTFKGNEMKIKKKIKSKNCGNFNDINIDSNDDFNSWFVVTMKTGKNKNIPKCY